MKTLPSSIITQKNLLSTPGSWLIFLDITYSGETTLRFVNNTEDVVFPGSEPLADRTYTKWAFGLGQVREAIKGDLPRVTFALYDVGLTLRSTLQANNGWSGGEVRIKKAFVTKAGVATDSEIIQYFTILDTIWDDNRNLINFNLGISTPLNKRFPRDRYVATICRHRFRGGFCRYGEEEDVNGYHPGLMVDNKISFYASDIRAYIKMWSYASYKLTIPGRAAEVDRFSAGQTIEVSGSVLNEGRYMIDESNWGDEAGWTRLYLTSDYALITENRNVALTITLTAICDHSLTICQANNNSHRYGASPGVTGGLYG